MAFVGYFLATKQTLPDPVTENLHADRAPSSATANQPGNTIQSASPDAFRLDSLDDMQDGPKLQSLGPFHEALQRYAECVTAIPFEMRRAKMRDACSDQRSTLMNLVPSEDVEHLFEGMDETLAMHQPESALDASTPTNQPHVDAEISDVVEEPMDSAQASQAHDAMQQYYDCVVGHPEFARSLEESQADCLTERSAAAGYFSSNEAERILHQFDHILMEHWQNLEWEP